MKGGTYARALEAGFSEEHAAFFAHLSCDTFNETLQEIERRENATKIKIRRSYSFTFLEMIVVFIVGISIGFAF